MEVTDQFEVHFGDGQCQRYYLKRIAGPVGKLIGADASQRGDEAVLRAVASQFSLHRGERLERGEWLQTRLGMAALALATDARGWPCLQAVPAGGQTVSAAWFLRRDDQLYEIGYQAGVAPATGAGAAMTAARAEAAAFLEGIDLQRTLEQIQAAIRSPADHRSLAVMMIAMVAVAMAMLILFLLMLEGPGQPVVPDWNAQGIILATSVDGTLNDDTDVDRAWVLEAAIPFENFQEVARHTPPHAGDVWHVNLNRLGGRVNSQYSQWSPGKSDRPQFHTPEYFGRMTFENTP